MLRDSNHPYLSVQDLLYAALESSHFDPNKETELNFTDYINCSLAATDNTLSLLFYRYNYIP